ncbi:MAG: helical backbone metal receptor, partial [Gemmatimonadaceae bacterium]
MFALSLAATRVALCLPLAAACGRDAPARQVALDPVAPRRSVSLGPSGTEILASLGMVDRMVGRSKWDLWPDTVRFIPELGDAIRPSVELIVAARPDLVVLYRAADNVAAAEALERAGIRVVSLRIDTIEEFFGGVDSLGRIVGAGPRADSITRALREELRDVRERLRPGAPVRVFVPVWEEPLMTVGAGSFLSELVGIAGGRNVYDDETAPSLTVS